MVDEINNMTKVAAALEVEMVCAWRRQEDGLNLVVRH